MDICLFAYILHIVFSAGGWMKIVKKVIGRRKTLGKTIGTITW